MKSSLLAAVAAACLLSTATFGISRVAAQGQIQSVRIEGVPVVVVDFSELARQEALRPRASGTIPYLVPEPHEFEEPATPITGEPPNPAAVVDVVPGPSIPSPSAVLNYDGEIDQAVGGGTVGTYMIPPDTMGAVGTDGVNKVFTTVNNNYKIQNKTTGAQISLVSMASFWGGTGATSPFDPRIQYDPYNDRWIVAAVTEAQTATTSILVGVSQTNDPSGLWNLAKVPARVAADPATTNFADFPMLGFNKNWIVVTVNMFGSTFIDDRALVIDYPSLRGGSLNPPTYFTGLTDFCMHPATTYSATEGVEYLVTHLGSGGASYRLRTITGTSAAPVLSAPTDKTRPGGGWATVSGNILPQANGTCAATPMLINAGDQFIRHNVVFRNNSIWYAQTIGLPAPVLTHTAVQWTQLDTAGNTLQGGRIDDPTATASNGGKWYAYPSIAVNGSNDVLLGFSQASSAQFASAGYAYKDHTDAAGTMRDPAIYMAGQDCYSKDFNSGRNRWGDYSHTMVDPTGDRNFWTIQEYARPQAAPSVLGSTSKWGTRWAKVNRVIAAFTDDPIVNGVTQVKVVHISELRTRVNAVRVAQGLGAFSFTDPTLTAGATVILAAHVTELRTALAEAYVAAGIPAPTYTDPGLSPGTDIKAVHITELRTAVGTIE